MTEVYDKSHSLCRASGRSLGMTRADSDARMVDSRFSRIEDRELRDRVPFVTRVFPEENERSEARMSLPGRRCRSVYSEERV
jgi:hypothetical protein